MAKIWEYLVIDEPVHANYAIEKLNSLGKEGWELVCGDTSKTLLYFKRVKSM